MFKYNQPTDYEKLVIANSYIRELKSQLRKQERVAFKAKQNLFKMIEYFKSYTSGTRKISSYKREMDAHRAKSKAAIILSEKLTLENHQLRQDLAKVMEIYNK